jgi:hypothetical protein
LTNIPGATGSNLVVNTTGWVPGTYVYDFVAVNSYGTNTGPTVNIVIAQITLATLTDIGGTAPTPGSNDISQFTTVGYGVPGLNYYWDNGSAVGAAAGSPPAFIGQTFTTGNSPQGYVLSSVAFQTYCCGHGGSAQGCSYLQSQSFTLNIYQISGTNLTDATLLNSFIATGQLQADGDWMQWDGLAVALAPGTNYAWAFGISATNACDNWEPLSTASGWPYTNGQACEIIDPGGPGSVIYSSVVNQYDAVFDIGLTIPSAPVAGTPFESPSYANSGVAAGTDVTLTASAAGR